MRDAENGELHDGVGRSGCAAPELDSKGKKAVELRELLKPGDTVYTKLNHVSRSGMTRSIEVMVFRDNAPVNITGTVAEVLDYKIHNKHWGLKVGGCGMDMGFHVVYSLSRRLFPDGFGEKCTHCDYRPGTKEEAIHCNEEMGADPHEFWGRNANRSGWDNNGGYALRHRWI